MKSTLSIAFLLLLVLKTFAQVPSIEWQNTIGGSQGDRTWQIIQTLDGGYLVSGESNSGFSRDKSEQNNGTFDFWIVKLNVIGGIEWQKTLGGNLYNDVPFITQTSDGGYMIIGSSNSGISGNKTVPTFGGDDLWLIKLNVNGVVLWQKNIGGSRSDFACCINNTHDGNLLIGASSYSEISGLKTEACRGLFDYWLLELDQQGNIIWQKTLGGAEYDTVSSFIKLPDNSYLIAGTSASNISIDKTENGFGDNDFWILKLDPNRNIEWQKTIGGNERDNLSDIILMPDNCFMVGGESYSGVSGNKTTILTGGTSENDYWVLKMNLNGDIIWQKSYGGNGSDRISNLDRTLDGNYVLTGISNSDISGDKTENSKGDDDIWIIKINENGTILWDKTLGGSEQDYLLARTMVATNDGGFIVASTSLSPISGDKTEWATSSDYWIVKFGIDNLLNESFLDSKNISIFPNPTSYKVNIALKNNLFINKITILNELGQILKEFNDINNLNYSLQLNYGVGIYFLKIENQNNAIEVVKIIKTK